MKKLFRRKINIKHYNNVTKKWLKKATPNSHKVKDRKYFKTSDGIKYYVDGKNVVLDYSDIEKQTANWLEETFGGKIYMLPRVNNPKGISTADYLWKDEYWDRKGMKSSTSKKRAFSNAIKNCKNQSHNFIIDLTECKLTNRIIIKQIKKSFNNNNKLYIEWLEKVIIKRNDKLIKIIIKK